ncbi:hypothetical protein B296_00024931 [Ensete ventricosum]|uniref:Uncharacterized protein n=1 Tax=Ensete ventricosum TaxID=4639 RepID=A0A426YCV1_ENSVE|nr:hypothetical protein B296_00024931 [Ensete ventricosum]
MELRRSKTGLRCLFDDGAAKLQPGQEEAPLSRPRPTGHQLVADIDVARHLEELRPVIIIQLAVICSMPTPPPLLPPSSSPRPPLLRAWVPLSVAAMSV